MLRAQYSPANCVCLLALSGELGKVSESDKRLGEREVQFGLHLWLIRKLGLHGASDSFHHGAFAGIRFRLHKWIRRENLAHKKVFDRFGIPRLLLGEVCRAPGFHRLPTAHRHSHEEDSDGKSRRGEPELVASNEFSEPIRHARWTRQNWLVAEMAVNIRGNPVG